MTINLKNFLNDKTKMSKMGEFQKLKQIEGLEMSSVSADLYDNGRDDLVLFYFSKGANYATVNTTSSIISETISWNNSSHKKLIKGLMVNTKNANTFTGKQGKESLDLIAKNLSRILTIKESKSEGGTSETVRTKDFIYFSDSWNCQTCQADVKAVAKLWSNSEALKRITSLMAGNIFPIHLKHHFQL